MQITNNFARFSRSPLSISLAVIGLAALGCHADAVPPRAPVVAKAVQEAPAPTEVAPSIILPNDQWRIVRYVHVDGEPGIVIHRTGMAATVDGVVWLRNALSLEDALTDTDHELYISDVLNIDWHPLGEKGMALSIEGLDVQDEPFQGEIGLFMARSSPMYAVNVVVTWPAGTLPDDQAGAVRQEVRLLAVTGDAVNGPVQRDRAVPHVRAK